MITHFQQITIIKIRSPEQDLNREIQWLSRSLGLFSERDKDRSCYRLFLEVIKAKQALSSDELAYRLNLSRATVIHHLSKLIAAGIVVSEDNKYILREKNLESTLKLMKQDMVQAFDEIEEMGKEIDKKLGL